MILDDKQKEIAAKKLCEIRGIDPDDQVIDKEFRPGCDVLMYCRAWQNLVPEIESHIAIAEALNF